MMKTATRASESWVVEVVDQRDTSLNLPGYVKRFTFTGEDAAVRAWACKARAERAGFLCKADPVKRV